MKKYLITSPKFYTDESTVFRDKLEKQLKRYQPDFVLFRDKLNTNYHVLAKDFMDICLKFQTIKSFIHTDVELAKKLHAHGVHLPSHASKSIQKAKSLGLEVIISTHTYAEVFMAEELGADYVTYSPIFDTPDKGEPKGVEDLHKLLQISKVKVFALGGITSKKEISKVAKTNVYGFASIGYFVRD